VDALFRLPVTHWLALTAESEARLTTMPSVSDATAVSLTVPVTSTPGITAQPFYFHNAVGESTKFLFRASGINARSSARKR
jgi:hypothetical protein